MSVVNCSRAEVVECSRLKPDPVFSVCIVRRGAVGARVWEV